MNPRYVDFMKNFITRRENDIGNYCLGGNMRENNEGLFIKGIFEDLQRIEKAREEGKTEIPCSCGGTIKIKESFASCDKCDFVIIC